MKYPLKTYLKQSIPFIVLCLLWFSPSFLNAQKILIVNNQALTIQSDAVYQSLQEAIDNANNGDILHIIPSLSSYGDILLNKNLELYGIGVNDQIHQLQSTVGTISVTANNDLLLADIVLSGLNFSDLLLQNPAENLQVIANRFNRIIHTNGTLKNAYFLHNIFERFNFDQPDNENVVLANNVINVSFTGSNAQSSQTASQILIFNNLFLSNATAVDAFLPAFREINSAVIQGNIFYGVSPNSAAITNSLIQNNSSFRSSRPDFPTSTNGNTVSNNIENVNPQLVNLPLLSFWQFAFDANLESSSPLKNAGQDGTDIGPLAGFYPWYPSQSPLPFIESIDVQVQPDNSLRVRIKAQKN
jgi:hypothetical protein